MVKEFYELEVWKMGKGCVIQIYKLTKEFPKQETYGLIDQLRRAANSICANIAEGFDRYHTKDKIRFYYTARASISECKSHLLIAQELGYLKAEQVQPLLADLNSVGRLLNNMIASLNNLSRLRSSPVPSSRFKKRPQFAPEDDKGHLVPHFIPRTTKRASLQRPALRSQKG